MLISTYKTYRSLLPACAALLLVSCSTEAVEDSREQVSQPSDSVANQQHPDGEVQWIDPNTIQAGPVRRETLTDQQMARIKALQITFVEIDGQSVEQWVDSFKRDANPDRELAIWERMAKVYQGYCSRHELELDAKKEVYKVVLLRSMAPPEDVLQRLELEIISKDDAIEIMNDY